MRTFTYRSTFLYVRTYWPTYGRESDIREVCGLDEVPVLPDMKDSAPQAHEEAHKGCTHMRIGTISNKRNYNTQITLLWKFTRRLSLSIFDHIWPHVKDEQKFNISVF